MLKSCSNAGLGGEILSNCEGAGADERLANRCSSRALVRARDQENQQKADCGARQCHEQRLLLLV